MLKNIKDCIRPTLRKTLRKKGSYLIEIILNWENFVGKKNSNICCATNIQFDSYNKKEGVLIINVKNTLATFLMHSENEICDNINSYFGFKLIKRLKIKQNYK